MTLTDTHTHLYDPAFDADGGGSTAVDRAIAAGVERMIFPNVDTASVEPLETLAAQYPGRVFMAMGLHPTEVHPDWQPTLAAIEARILAAPERYVAIGEVGIDLYWDTTCRQEQIEAFERQARLAVQLDKPVIIHCREGLADTLDALRRVPGVRAVFHSFGGTADDVAAIRAEGDFYFGINGIVTFKNSGLREVLPEIGSGRIMLETDSPYLAPVPKRGRRNESAYLPYIAQTVADALEMSVEKLAEITTANAAEFFRLPASV